MDLLTNTQSLLLLITALFNDAARSRATSSFIFISPIFSYFLIVNNIMPATVCFVYQRTMQTTFAGSKSSIKCPENFIQNGGKKMSSQMREFVQVWIGIKSH